MLHGTVVYHSVPTVQYCAAAFKQFKQYYATACKHFSTVLWMSPTCKGVRSCSSWFRVAITFPHSVFIPTAVT